MYRSIKTLETDSKEILQDEKWLKCKIKPVDLPTDHDFPRNLLNKNDYKGIKEFCLNDETVTRNSDKSNTFVVLQKKNY